MVLLTRPTAVHAVAVSPNRSVTQSQCYAVTVSQCHLVTGHVVGIGG